MSSLLDLDALACLPSLTLRSRTLAEASLQGEHRAKLPGGSAEFREHRIYNPGDPLRSIDWKVFGRTDKYYVRSFEEDRKLLAYVCLDTSGSMGFGRKLDIAKRLAAALSWLLLRDGNAVGLFLMGEQASYLPARGGEEQRQRIMALLEGCTPRGNFLFPEKIQELLERQRRRALVFVIGDLLSFGADGTPTALLPIRLLAQRGHDVSLLQILHPEELSFPYDDLCEFDTEEDGKALLDAASIAEAYREELRGFLALVEKGCAASGVLYQRVLSTDKLEMVLQEQLRQRQSLSPIATR